MPSVLIIGGNGQVARLLTKRLLSKGTSVHSVIRKQDQVQGLTDLGALPIVQSIEESSVLDFVKLIKDTQPSVVIWSAGAGASQGDPSRTTRVDQEGHIKITDAIAQAAKEADTTRRFISVSALDVRDKDNKPAPDWYSDADKKLSDRVWGVIGSYMRARCISDKSLVEDNERRGLDYTIVRPGGLSQDPGTGKVAAGRVSIMKRISREDVAAVIEECIGNDKTIGLVFDVVGGDLSIEEAVEKAEDTFQGYY